MPDDYFAHPTAVIEKPVTIGEASKIWCFCHLMAGATIGRRCVLGQNVMVASHARLGDNVHVQNNVSIYDGVILEDDVFCGPSAVFTNVINPRSAFPRRNDYLPTRVGRGATIGANATILCGVTLGAHCFVAAGAVVTHDVPEHALMMGVPARQRGWMSRLGRRLEFGADSLAVCDATGDVYRLHDNDAVQLEHIGTASPGIAATV